MGAAGLVEVVDPADIGVEDAGELVLPDTPPRCRIPSQPSTSRITAAASARSQGMISSCGAGLASPAMSESRSRVASGASRARISRPTPPAAPVIKSLSSFTRPSPGTAGPAAMARLSWC